MQRLEVSGAVRPIYRRQTVKEPEVGIVDYKNFETVQIPALVTCYY